MSARIQKIPNVEREGSLKKEKERDPELEKKVIQWVEEITGSTFKDGFEEGLRDGVILCRLINKLQPGSIQKINEERTPFKMMENIEKYLNACELYGVKKMNLFQVVDLYEGANLLQVASSIFALGRRAQSMGYNGPRLGPKEAESVKRVWPKGGDNHIPLQSGTNKGATQKGQTPYGLIRQINHNPVFRAADEDLDECIQ